MLDALVADLIEVHLSTRSPVVGTHLRDHELPGGARVALVVRTGLTFVPDGDTVLAADDVLLLAVAPDTSPDTLVEWASPTESCTRPSGLRGGRRVRSRRRRRRG